MAFFDKLKEIKQTFSEVKAGIQKSINDMNMSAEERNAAAAEARAAQLNALVDETSLVYTPCSDFELEEMEDQPGKYKITGYVGFSIKGNIEIPAKINGQEIYAIGKELFLNNKELQYVKLAEGIKKIECDAFRESSLMGIVLPESLEVISARAFMKTALQKIAIPDNVSFIGRSCFYKCTDLLSAKLPANKQTLPDYLFFGCMQLMEVTIPQNLVSVGHDAFVLCSEIPQSLEILGSNGLILPYSIEFRFPEHLHTVHNKLFKNLNCDKLYIPANLKLIQTDELFYGMEPDESDFNLDERETDLGHDAWQFSVANTGYEEIIFAPGSEYSLSGVNGPFRNCKNLKKLYIPSSMTEFDNFDGLFGKHETHTRFVSTKDCYGRDVLDHDGTKMGHLEGKDSTTILPPPNPDFVLYCQAGSAALKFAKKFELACEEWII